MSRFGSRVNVAELRKAVPLSPFFFDCLHLDGEDLIDQSARHRLEALERRLPAALRVPSAVTEDPAEAQRFLEDALARGHEGVMVKSLEAPVRGRAARGGLAQGQGRAHARSRRPRRGVGARPPAAGSSRTSISARAIRRAAAT